MSLTPLMILHVLSYMDGEPVMGRPVTLNTALNSGLCLPGPIECWTQTERRLPGIALDDRAVVMVLEHVPAARARSFAAASWLLPR